MTVHISARLAWHQDGWNGHVCGDPAANVYCVGRHSYPGEMIAETRDLAYESNPKVAGQCCSKLDRIPPCVYSINAFGSQQITAFSDPPDFFYGGAKRIEWKLPPATVCIWPYEEMYGDDVKRPGGTFDYDKRLQNAKDFFGRIEPAQSLVFYYSNYSNPLNQEDERRYVVVGMSRIKRVGPIRFYDECDDRIREKYAGGFIWQCDITSEYPDQGLRLPYHVYRNEPEKLARFAFFPDNPRLFKYATRGVSDDDALDLVERLLETCGTLQELGDKTEDWTVRAHWLESLIAELWQARGLYPGMAKVLNLLGFEQAIPYWKVQVERGKEQPTKDALFAWLSGKQTALPGLKVSDADQKRILRQWKLKTGEERALLQDTLPRFDLLRDQMDVILAKDRAKHSIYSSLDAIQSNPYILSEEYVGNSPDDLITLSKIDHGVFPSPELGGETLAENDDPRRLRALCVERLRRETKHTFVGAEKLLQSINHALSYLPDWKSHQFTEQYFDVDEEFLSEALVFRTLNDCKYLYWRPVYEAEREVEAGVRGMADGPDIAFKSPVTEKHWHSYLKEEQSPLNQKAPQEYAEAIAGQAQVCDRIFRRPLAVLCGAAGTGKTTVIKSLIRAIEKAHGSGTSFKLLAPTGKAADRIRAATGKDASTIHSFLAQKGWLNQNRTFKRAGGKREESVQTFIIDEASMLDLDVAATLFRAVNWKTVQRLILVGDPNQLPPIGRGKLFADVISWLRSSHPEDLAELQINVRQMENRATKKGQAILELASVFLHSDASDQDDEARKATTEEMLRRVQEGGDVDDDLRVIYWNKPEDLAQTVIGTIVADMEAETGTKLDPEKPKLLWQTAFEEPTGEKYPRKRPDFMQVTTPYCGELFGTEHLNSCIQKHIHGLTGSADAEFSPWVLDGIMLGDKVIQIRNRPASDRIHAYNTISKATELVEMFNGELGFVKPHGYDKKFGKYFRLEHFQVIFARKEQFWVGYGSKLGKNAEDRWISEEKVEENLELAYAISVHKAQGSEFDRVYFIVPKLKAALMSPELFYTGLTRGKRHCTLFVEQDIGALTSLLRRERSHLLRIDSSLFEFRPLPPELLQLGDWYEEGKIYHTLTEFMVRSKSEVIIANMLHERDIQFRYELPLFAEDGTFYLPDFTLNWRGEHWYWEHWGRMDLEKYRRHKAAKCRWYEKFFPGRLIETVEAPDLTQQANAVIRKLLSD